MSDLKITTFKLHRHEDARGYLEEVFKPFMLPKEHQEFGQCFLTTAKPGVVKGNHWHKQKYELFYIVKGIATVYFKDLATQEVVEINLSDEDPKVLVIPPGPLHAIKNIGDTDFYLMIYTDKKSMEVDINDNDTFYQDWIR